MSSTAFAEPLVPPGAALPPAATRPGWSGLLQLSLVGIPIKAFPAVRTREVSFARFPFLVLFGLSVPSSREPSNGPTWPGA